MKYRRKPDVRFRIVADEAVVVRQKDAEVIVLNEVGGRILELIEERLDHDVLAERLADEFDSSVEQLASDVDQFLAQLVEAGVIEPV